MVFVGPPLVIIQLDGVKYEYIKVRVHRREGEGLSSFSLGGALAPCTHRSRTLMYGSSSPDNCGFSRSSATMAESKTAAVLPASIDFSEQEAKVLAMWREIDAFQSSLTLNSGKPAFTFYDGPPFATGLLHYGHILAGTIKDTITRFQHMMGHHVERRFGWDCHGLPVEYEIDKKLGITGPDDITGPNGMGIRKYNSECRAIVGTERMARSLRWVAGLTLMMTTRRWSHGTWRACGGSSSKSSMRVVYQSYKVMPYSTACCTPLSNFEAQQNYKEGIIDPAVVITFALTALTPDRNFCLTTTPWTLPSIWRFACTLTLFT